MKIQPSGQPFHVAFDIRASDVSLPDMTGELDIVSTAVEQESAFQAETE